MPGEVLAALVGGALSAGSALAGTRMKNEAQRRENEMAFERNQRAIREQNAYNSASAQMARLQAAGLNPNLIYDQNAGGAAGMQESAPEYQPAQLDNAFGQVGSIGSEMIQSAIGLKDMENKTLLALAEEANKNASTALTYLQQRQGEEELRDFLLMRGYRYEQFVAETLNKWQNLEEGRSRIDLNAGLLRDAEGRVRVSDATVDKFLQDIEESKERTKNYSVERALNREKIRDLAERRKMDDAMYYMQMQAIEGQLKVMTAQEFDLWTKAEKGQVEMTSIVADMLRNDDYYELALKDYEDRHNLNEEQIKTLRKDRKLATAKLIVDSTCQVIQTGCEVLTTAEALGAFEPPRRPIGFGKN